MTSSSLLNIALVVCTFLFAVLVQHNPLLFGRKVPAADGVAANYRIFRNHPVLERHLQPFVPDMGDDYVPYRNHCLRVLTFAVYHCGHACSAREVDLMAMALAYHDVALWSDRKLNYLEPSARQMELHANDGDDHGEKDEGASSTEWTSAEIATADEIILQHHKLTDWKGAVEGDTSSAAAIDARLVNCVRKGDWADATVGLVRFGLPATLLEVAYEQIPEVGFHRVLMEMGPRLSPDSLLGRLDVLNIFKW